jgi:RNA polymerase sigma factor (sigma-70 family)
MEQAEQVQLAQQGDEQAFAELCLSFKQVIQRYANRSHLGTLREDAAAAGQLAVVAAIQSYDAATGVPVGAYVEQQIQYALWNLFKKERKVWQHTLSYDISRTNEDGSSSTWLDSIADTADLEPATTIVEVQADFRKELEAFPHRQQQVLLGLLAGFTLTEIGSRLHISTQAVYKIKIRAQNRLKKRLVRNGEYYKEVRKKWL